MLEVTWVQALLSTVSASFPMICFLLIVWWIDRYDREPLWLVGVAFLWGAVGSVLLALAGSAVLTDLVTAWCVQYFEVWPSLVRGLSQVAGTVIIAPVIEEPAKALILLVIIWSKHFDNMTDGFVYGSAAGLGFGMTENFLYFLHAGSDFYVWGATVLVRTFYSAVMHATATAIVGAALGYGRWLGPRALAKYGCLGMGIALFIHGLWNGLLTLDLLEGSGNRFSMVNLVVFPLEVFITGFVFQACLWDEEEMIRTELQEEVEKGLIPDGHPDILASWWRRTGWAWVPEGVPQWTYIFHANMLAMRKRQARYQGNEVIERHLEDIRMHRFQLERLLNKDELTEEVKRPTPVTRFIRNFRDKSGD
jgi:protease PrsW